MQFQIPRKSHQQHNGELFVQKKRHAPLETGSVMPRIASDEMPMQHAIFFNDLPYFAISTLDHLNQPWATIITGKSGHVVKVLNDKMLKITTQLPADDPFAKSICQLASSYPRYFAGLGVDFSNRRRNKVGGYIIDGKVQDKTLSLDLVTDDNLGNCPKYITVRDLQPCSRNATTVIAEYNAPCVLLLQEEIDVILQASTMFIATRHFANPDDSTDNTDLGLNHRGGPPGFCRVYTENSNSYIIIPDYSGNRFYQSLGNVQTDNVAGLVFPNFHNGDMLHITGVAENLFDDEAEAIMPRQSLITRIRVTGHVLIKGGLQLELIGKEQLSPYNPPVKFLKIEVNQKPMDYISIEAKLVGIVPITQLVTKYTFQLDKAVQHLPGGFAVFDFNALVQKEYRHMNNQRPQQLNDDYLRTWTISSAPSRNHGFEPTDVISCTIKLDPNGQITPLLHHFRLKNQLGVKIKLAGVGGRFSCFASDIPKKQLWIAGGIGVTPFLSMVESIKSSDALDIVVLYAAKEDELVLAEYFKKPFISNIKLFASKSKQNGIVSRRMELKDLREVDDLGSRKIYMCGSMSLMESVKEWLNVLGVAQNLETEEFIF